MAEKAVVVQVVSILGEAVQALAREVLEIVEDVAVLEVRMLEA